MFRYEHLYIYISQNKLNVETDLKPYTKAYNHDFLGFIINIGTALLFQVDDSLHACIYIAHIRFPTLHNMYAPYNIVVNTLLPTVVMGSAYARMGYMLYHSEFASKDKKQAQINMFETCLLMMIMFTLSSLNTCISLLLFTAGYFKDLSSDYYTISIILLVSNHCINPFIYSLRYKEFQHQLKCLVCLAQVPLNPARTSTNNTSTTQIMK